MTLLELDPFVTYRKELEDHGLLITTALEGVYIRSKAFETIVRGLDDALSRAGAGDGGTPVWTSPIVPRALLEQTDYVRSFPQLMGIISSYQSGERGFADLLAAVDAGDWAGQVKPTGLALASAACHSVYPTLEGQQLENERRFEVFGQCFRHEPSPDPARMQSFRMHEFVYVGSPQGAREHRAIWIERAEELLSALGLDVEAVEANDPFFGRAGSLLATTQRSEALKIELVAPVASVDAPTAIASVNYHLDHFGTAFSIAAPSGGPAHSACVGFGNERVVLALLRRHGLDPAAWPGPVRRQLEL